MSVSRNTVFEALGTIPRNPRWSWCALAPNHERAVFTIWEDHLDGDSYLLFKEQPDTKLHHGEKELKENLDIVLAKGIPSFGLLCEAESATESPRSIGQVHTEHLYELQIEEKEEGIYGEIVGKIGLINLIRDINSEARKQQENGLDDLDHRPKGHENPDRAKVSSMVVVRDPRVRSYVINKAGGKCEYCGELGFRMQSGRRYLEAHHIINLAEQGQDTVDNVIALCPEHHREAHFGERANELEEKFLECIVARAEE